MPGASGIPGDMIRCLSLFAALAIGGCATSSHTFAPISTPRTATGQVRYEGGGRSVIGELLVSQGAEGGRLEFGKGAGVSLLRVLSDKTSIRFEGPLARGTRELPRGRKLPDHLVVWGQLVERPVSAGTGSFSHDGEKITYQLSVVR